MNALDNYDLMELMRSEPHFIGVYPLDRLPQHVPPKAVPLKLIVNLDPINLEGSHWVALYRRMNDGQGYYFDTYARPPPNEIKCWLESKCNTWKHNTRVLQAATDRTSCGFLCVTFLRQLP
jgi:hypothetical protein